jgi:large conductance mechanosensitive channel
MDDDTPKGLLGELRTTILRKRVGQIALAVVLAEAIWRLVSALTWYLIIPLIGRFLHGQTESVLLEAESSKPIRWDTIFGSVLEFVLVVIVVIFLNRWIQRKPSRPDDDDLTDDSTEEEPLEQRN